MQRKANLRDKNVCIFASDDFIEGKLFRGVEGVAAVKVPVYAC